MNDNSPPEKTTPFCNRSWKAPAAIMGLACLATFAWGFHILQDYAISKRLIGSGGAGFMSSLRAVGVGGAAMNKLNSFNRSAVVNIASLNANGAPGAGGQLTSAGTGVIVNPSGYVITALHLISGLQDIVVRAMTPAGIKTYEAQIVKISPSHDLAMLKLISRDIFTFVTLGNSQALQVGQPVYAFGDPQGADLIVKEGVIQNLRLNVNIADLALTNMIHTDAVYIWGQTGGPLVNKSGLMIGLNITATNPSGQVIGYTIPSHIIVSHFQDVVQFLTSVNEAGVARPVSPAPDSAQNMAVAPQETEMGRNAAGRRPITKTQISTNSGWWKKARVFLDRQSGAPANSLYPMGVNTAFTTSQNRAKDAVHSPGWTLWGYSLYSVAGLLLLGFVSGISGGMMTMGGGIIKITGLMLFFGYGILLVRPVAYITNIFIYGAASIRYNDSGLITFKNIRPLLPWAMAGIIVGYFVGNSLEMETIRYLLGAFALWIAINIFAEIYQLSKDTSDKAGQFAGYDNDPLTKGGETMLGRLFGRPGGQGGYISNDMARNGSLGFPMGIVSGILGISGGIVEVPLQRYVAGAPLKNAIANSAVMVFCASIVGSVVAMAHGVGVGAFEWETPLALATILIPGAYLGGMVGAWLTKMISINILKWIYATLMLAIAVRMFLP
ncbi:MAG TPA: trypsin-like serine protease [Nitrospirae bacterium]|nr:trypsin-like serine protease [Nitrospirota bacterium]